MLFLTQVGSTLGRVHPAPRNSATSATKTAFHQPLRKVQKNALPSITTLFCHLSYSLHNGLYVMSVLFSTSVEQGFCSDPWIPYNGNCFHLNRTPQTWSNAQRECRKEGGDLVSIHNVEQQSFVISQLGFGT